ncbi:MAG: DoxX family protein [Gammaproteobacteria bacterium]|nr:DoxX family protein [Gammaproteobacteria bacterium]
MMAICKLLEKCGPLAGRLLLAHIFILSGYRKLTGWEGTLGYMASKGLPMTEVLLALTILVELGGGLLLLLGYKARWAATAIFLFLIPVTLIFHNFWALAGQEQFTQLIQFQKNLAIMGGMLYVMVYGSGAYSLSREKCA